MVKITQAANSEITKEVNERDKVYFENAKIDYVQTISGDGQFKVIRV
jgi:hypothetical protein